MTVGEARLFAVPTMACSDWTTNAELLAAVVELGYLDPERDLVVDVTYGRGNWWTIVKPARLVAHDLHTVDGVDFRDLPEADRSVDVVTFDPPYVPQGGTIHMETGHRYRDGYGLNGAPTNRHELTDLVLAGLGECVRILRPGGVLLMKCQPFQSGRVFHHMPAKVISYAEHLGVRLDDELIHRRNPGPTSAKRFTRARRNHSNLLVFRRRHRAAKPRSGT